MSDEVSFSTANLKDCDLQEHFDAINSLRKTLPSINSADYLEFVYTLHDFIITSSGNSRLTRYLLAFRSQLALFHLQFRRCTQLIDTDLNDIALFLVALKAGEREEAIKLLSKHFQTAKNGVLLDRVHDEA